MIKIFIGVVVDLAFAFVTALPVMVLANFLHDNGMPGSPQLGYWASYVVALFLMWLYDGIKVPSAIMAEMVDS